MLQVVTHFVDVCEIGDGVFDIVNEDMIAFFLLFVSKKKNEVSESKDVYWNCFLITLEQRGFLF